MTQYKDLYNILARIGKELHSDPKNNTNYTQHIEELKQYLQNNKEIAIDKAIFQAVISRKTLWEVKISQEAIHRLLSHCIKNGNNIKSNDKKEKTLSFQEVINCLKDAMRIQKCFSVSVDELLNYPDEDGNSLLHKAVLANNTDAIKTLLANDVNSLAVNKDNKTPLMLANVNVKGVLVDGMEKQAKQHKESAMANISIAFVAGFFSTIGMGVTMSMVLGDGANSPSIAVGIGVSLALLVGGIAALAVYSFSQDYKQAKAIDCVLVKDASLEGAKITHVSGNNQEQAVNV